MVGFSFQNENNFVSKLSGIIASECGYSPFQTSQIQICAALHDIGKQKIPKEILNKPGKLNNEEFEIMKTHTKLGAEMLARVQGELGIMARNTALYHHEWYNGNGYWGKRSGDLPFYVSIVSIADVFVALVCKRVYKPAWPPKQAVEYIQSQSGTQFEHKLARNFINIIKNDSRVPLLFGGKEDVI